MERNLPHIKVLQPTDTLKFTTTQSGFGGSNFPQRDRVAHGQQIKQKLEQAWQDSENEIAVTHSMRTGTYIEFQSAPGLDIKIKSLEDLRKGIRLCNVRQEDADDPKKITSYITTFVPNDQKQFFFDKIEAYLKEETKKGNPKNKDLLEGVEDIRKAVFVESFWTDDKILIPDDGTKEWCEIWLRGDDIAKENFNIILSNLGIKSKPDVINFPERIVKLVFASRQDLGNLTKHSDDIAEYRRAKSTANFLLSETPSNQSEWVDNLVQRLTVNNTSNVTICLLDTGVNNGHPLIAPILANSDCQAVEPQWGTDDHDKHGTLMAGLSGYGDLQECLTTSNSVTIKHCLESVKIIPPTGNNAIGLWGYITKQGISKAEIQAPSRKRIICMPISAEDTRDQGRPSSWSAAIDQVTSGADDGERRLVIVAAGNADSNNWNNYPASNITDSIHDPAQSWNALTVGAITNLQDITDPTLITYKPLAKNGELSPFTTTSITWDDKWPIKPDVVFEGGNLAIDNTRFSTECNDLSLVSTFYKPTVESLYPFNMTSAATAQAAHFAACIQSEYPTYWPETVRGLIVHSARWPNAVKAQVAKNNNKTELKRVLRACGYGKPDLALALYCAENSLTLIAEAEIQPFEKDGSSFKTKDMHLYELPWPKDILESLGSSKVEMRITLSYFIEPGPGEIGWKDRYRYASHALRFELNSPVEDKEIFMKRINKNSRKENEEKPDSSSPTDHWVIGSNNRDKGSIHSDIWHGTAVELMSSNLIAISPRIGWWRERSNLKKYDQRTKYSLIVSISTPENEVDIYTPVKISISQPITISVRG